MKRILSIMGVVLFFLVLVALLIFKLFAPNTSSKPAVVSTNPFASTQVTNKSVYTDTPNRTVISCYTWYLSVYLTPATLDQIAAQSQASECFTSSFISQWNLIKATTEGDPVLTVADYAPTWASSIKAETVGQSVRTSDQKIILGTGEDSFTIVAHLQQQNDDGWKIDSVSKP